MAPLIELISCGIIEKDYNGDTIWTWSFPKISELEKATVLRKCSLNSDSKSTQVFTCSRYNHNWFYIYCSEVFDSDNLPMVKQLALVLFTKDFNLQKYKVLSRILSKTYCKTGESAEVLRLFLSIYTKGSCSTHENGTFISDDFQDHQQPMNTEIRKLIKTFDLETILIYTALLLKKKIIIYHHSLEQLFKWTVTIPAFMKHRNITDNLFPWIDLSTDEVAELQNYSWYIAGCNNSSVSLRTDLYDLLVNIPAREITIAPHAKESFIMTKTHKEIAIFMVQLAENQAHSEAQIISDINDRTQDLLNLMRTFALVETDEGKKISTKILKEKNLSPAVENFLTNLAIAEDLFIS